MGENEAVIGGRVAALIVTVGDVRLGLPVDVVGEVLRMVAVTDLPGAPQVVAGVVDLRGETIAVLDMRRRLGYPSRPPNRYDRLVLLRAATGPALAWVDDVAGVIALDTASVEALEGTLEASPHLSGLTRTSDGLLYLHDPDAFFSDREAAELDALLASRPPFEPHGVAGLSQGDH